MDNLYQALDRLLQTLDARSVPYALIGGIAVRAYAIPRNTNDIDIVVILDHNEYPQFFRELSNQEFKVPEPYLRGWIDRVREMPVAKIKVYLGGRGIDVDIFMVASSFQESLIDRRRRIEVDGRELWIATTCSWPVRLPSGQARWGPSAWLY